MLISRIGLGGWVFGGHRWRYGFGEQDDAESIATIRAAVEAGINWIDSAAVYGRGHSEEVIARALASLPSADRPYVFTKCGLVWDDSRPYEAPLRIGRPSSIRREVEASLRRLRVERIDLLHVHQPLDGHPDEWTDQVRAPSALATPLEEYWQTLADLRAEGKVGAIALSNHGVQELARAHSLARVDAIQPMLSVISRDAWDQVRWAEREGVGVLAYQPMYSGLLTGTFNAERVRSLPPTDWRRQDPEFTSHLTRNMKVVDVLQSVACEHGVSTATIAVAWVLAWRAVTGAIVGARRPDQISGWQRAGDVRLTTADLHRISEAIEGIGTGPTYPDGATTGHRQ